MSANDRIQWLHKKIAGGCYPNASHLSERFEISHRQAQRDVEYLRKDLDAPLEYCTKRKGYYYREEFMLPLLLESENDTDYQDVVSGLRAFSDLSAARSVIQMQLPYSAVLEITDKMTVMNLRAFIVNEMPHHRYLCEFPSVELFLGIAVSADADIRIISPDWLREKLVDFAKRILERNKQEES